MAKLLEPLGRDEGHDQVDREPQRHGETDNKFEHGVASELADGAGVMAERKKDTGAQRQIDQIEHGRTPTNEIRRSVALSASGFDGEDAART
jgi:hypothetical protein